MKQREFTLQVTFSPPSPSSIWAGLAAMQFFHYLADLDILCSGSFSHHVRIYSFMFMHKISNGWFLMDWFLTLYFFFSPRLALRDILCSGSFPHQIKFIVLCLCTRFPTWWLLIDWLKALYFFFSPRLALRDILCSGSFSHHIKIYSFMLYAQDFQRVGL